MNISLKTRGLVMNNAIKEFMNLKQEDIESLSCCCLNNELVVELSLIRKPAVCLVCNSVTSKVLNQYIRKINHGIFINRKCIVHYKQKRYKCLNCFKSFIEPCSLISKYQKKSLTSHIQMMELLKDPHLTFKKVGELLNVSTSIVIDSFYANLPDFTPTLPAVLYIDEVNLGRDASKKHVAVLLNFQTNQIVDIIYGRTKDALHSYFQKLPLGALKGGAISKF